MNFKFLRSLLLIGALCVLQSSICQRNFGVDFSEKIVLDSLNYNGHTATHYCLRGDQVYYVLKERKSLSIYVKNIENDSSRLIQQINNIPRNNFLTDFAVNTSLDVVYYLFNDGVVKLPVNQHENEFSNIDYLYETQFVNYNLDVYKNKLIISGCYNRYNDSDQPTHCPLSVVHDEGRVILRRELKHDAVALTHFPSYFFAVDFGYVAFTKSLTNEIVLLNLDSMIFSVVGDLKPLNDTITRLPFETKIGPESVAKKIIFKTREYTKDLIKIEGVVFVNDSTFCTVKKTGGTSIRSKRLIDVYRNTDENNWQRIKTKTFKNRIMTKRNHLFQFHLTNKVQVVGSSKWAISAMDIPEEINSNWKMKRYGENISTEDNLKQAVYVYKVQL